MNAVELHRAWAPVGGHWSPWVKPVLFAAENRRYARSKGPGGSLPVLAEGIAHRVLPALGIEARSGGYRDGSTPADLAVVVDLPAASGVDFGVALTSFGFRPIPLYNALPGPRAIVDVVPIIEALERGADWVGAVPLSAAPAFLLDSNRSGASGWESPVLFDNRSVCRPTDFPSAHRLAEAGLRRVLVVTERLEDDLGEVLLGWQSGGLELWQGEPTGDRLAERRILRAPWIGVRLLRAAAERIRPTPADRVYGTMIASRAAS